MRIFKKDTKSSVTTELKTIAEILVEDFRFSRSYLSVVDKLFMEEKKKYESTYNFHHTKIAELAKNFHLRMVFFDGKEYNEGLPVTSLNIDEFGEEERLIVQQTIEPTILTADGQIVKIGIVILSIAPNEMNGVEAAHKNK